MRFGMFNHLSLMLIVWIVFPLLQAAPALSNSPNSPYRQLSVLLEDMTQLKEKMELMESKLGKVEEKDSGLASFNEEIKRQKLAIEDFKTHQKALQEQFDHSSKENEALKAQILSLQRKLSEYQGKYQGAQNALKQLELSWEEAKKDINVLTSTQTKQLSRMETLERVGATAKIVQQHSDQIQAIQSLLKQQEETYGNLRLNLAKNADEIEKILELKEQCNKVSENINKLNEQNTDKTLLLGKISEENEGLRRRLDQMAPTAQLVQQQHDKIKQLGEEQQTFQVKLQQQVDDYANLKSELKKNWNELGKIAELKQQIHAMTDVINRLKDQNIDKTAVLEQISEETQARKMMFEQLNLANDALKSQLNAGGLSKSSDLVQLQQKVDALIEENRNFKVAQASLEQHYQLFFDEVNKQFKTIEAALSNNHSTVASTVSDSQVDQLQQQFNSLKRDLGDKWKDLADKCKTMCASTLNQTNDRLQSLAQQMQSNFEHLREKTFTKHVILSGESLASIAKHYQTTPAKILSVNNLPSAKNLKVGDVLWIPQDS